MRSQETQGGGAFSDCSFTSPLTCMMLFPLALPAAPRCRNTLHLPKMLTRLNENKYLLAVDSDHTGCLCVSDLHLSSDWYSKVQLYTDNTFYDLDAPHGCIRLFDRH